MCEQGVGMCEQGVGMCEQGVGMCEQGVGTCEQCDGTCEQGVSMCEQGVGIALYISLRNRKYLHAIVNTITHNTWQSIPCQNCIIPPKH